MHDNNTSLQTYQNIIRDITETASNNTRAYALLCHLCDTIGPRLAGSKALENAVEWAVQTLQNDGHTHVYTHPVQVPHWVRGSESLQLTHPAQRPLSIVGLGGSIPTEPDGLCAPVLVVRDEEDLTRKSAQARGKIVLFNAAMPPYNPDTRATGYGAVSRYRVYGADIASRHGAVAALVRSPTARSLSTPHTGMMRYSDNTPRIPTAAITTEDADLLARLSTHTTPHVALTLQSEDRATAQSHNVFAEIKGSKKPEEIVLISAHMDSWDTSPGAHDNASGCIMAIEALRILRTLRLQPARTLRLALFTNEEFGVSGGRNYAAHVAKTPNEHHVAALEADSGAFRPDTLTVQSRSTDTLQHTLDALAPLAHLLQHTGLQRITSGFTGTDIQPLLPHSGFLVGMMNDLSTYFDLHHTTADTPDKINPKHLNACIAAWTSTAYVIADAYDIFPTQQ